MIRELQIAMLAALKWISEYLQWMRKKMGCSMLSFVSPSGTLVKSRTKQTAARIDSLRPSLGVFEIQRGSRTPIVFVLVHVKDL